jgi:hypothetical protein
MGDVGRSRRAPHRRARRGLREQRKYLEGTHAEQTRWFVPFSGDPAWIQRHKQYGRDWCSENIASIHRYKFEQWRWVGAFNDWVPVANASHAAMAELEETAKLMGYDTSKAKGMAGFVEGLEAALDQAIELVDTPLLGVGKAQSWSSYKDDPAAPSQPNLQGEQLSPKLDGVVAAYRELQLAHHQVYLGLLADQKRELDARGGRISAEISQLNATIAFWTGVGGTVDKTAKHTKHFTSGKMGAAADRKIGGALGNDGRHHGQRALEDALQHRRQHEKNPSDYEAHIASHARSADYEDYHDTWGKGGESAGASAPAPASYIGFPDLSAKGILTFGLQLATHDKLEKLKRRLDDIENASNGLAQTISFTETRQRGKQYESARAKLRDELKKVDAASLRDRQQEYVKLGHDLDSYAVKHKRELATAKKAALVPSPGREVYATTLACMAKIDQYRALSKLALDMFPFNEFVGSIKAMEAERTGATRPRESAKRSAQSTMFQPPALPGISPEELEVYEAIAGTYLIALKRDARWAMRLAGVESRFAALMKKVTGQGNIEGTVGKEF